jgi:hypothetical protein
MAKHPPAPQTIRIDPDVWRALQKQAEPFVETPNDVLRRLLGLAPKKTANSALLAEAGKHNLHSGEGLAAFLKENFSGVKGLTHGYLRKVATANPNGINSKEIRLDRLAVSHKDKAIQKALRDQALADRAAMAEAIKKIAAPGTEIVTPSAFHSAKTLGVTKKVGKRGRGS